MFLLEVKISRQFIKNNRLFRLCTNVHAVCVLRCNLLLWTQVVLYGCDQICSKCSVVDWLSMIVLTKLELEMNLWLHQKSLLHFHEVSFKSLNVEFLKVRTGKKIYLSIFFLAKFLKIDRFLYKFDKCKYIISKDISKVFFFYNDQLKYWELQFSKISAFK